MPDVGCRRSRDPCRRDRRRAELPLRLRCQGCQCREGPAARRVSVEGLRGQMQRGPLSTKIGYVRSTNEMVLETPAEIRDLTLEEIEQVVEAAGERAFRARQIAGWLYGRSAGSF